MALPALQLLNSDGDPRGRRYTDGDREAAYRAWASIARRSYAKASEKTGIAENTLRSWGELDDWSGRVSAEDAAVAETGKAAVMATVVAEHAKSIATIVALRDDAAQPGKVRLDASLSLLAIGGISTRTTTTTAKEPAPPKPAVPGGRLSDEDRTRLADKLAGRVASIPPRTQPPADTPTPSRSQPSGE